MSDRPGLHDGPKEETAFGRLLRWVLLFGLAALPIWFLLTALLTAPSVDDDVEVSGILTVTSEGEVQLETREHRIGASWATEGLRAAAILLGVGLGLAVPLAGYRRYASRRTQVTPGRVDLSGDELYGDAGWTVQTWRDEGSTVGQDGRGG